MPLDPNVVRRVRKQIAKAAAMQTPTFSNVGRRISDTGAGVSAASIATAGPENTTAFKLPTLGQHAAATTAAPTAAQTPQPMASPTSALGERPAGSALSPTPATDRMQEKAKAIPQAARVAETRPASMMPSQLPKQAASGTWGSRLYNTFIAPPVDKAKALGKGLFDGVRWLEGNQYNPYEQDLYSPGASNAQYLNKPITEPMQAIGNTLQFVPHPMTFGIGTALAQSNRMSAPIGRGMYDYLFDPGMKAHQDQMYYEREHPNLHYSQWKPTNQNPKYLKAFKDMQSKLKFDEEYATWKQNHDAQRNWASQYRASGGTGAIPSKALRAERIAAGQPAADGLPVGMDQLPAAGTPEFNTLSQTIKQAPPKPRPVVSWNKPGFGTVAPGAKPIKHPTLETPAVKPLQPPVNIRRLNPATA